MFIGNEKYKYSTTKINPNLKTSLCQQRFDFKSLKYYKIRLNFLIKILHKQQNFNLKINCKLLNRLLSLIKFKAHIRILNDSNDLSLNLISKHAEMKNSDE